MYRIERNKKLFPKFWVIICEGISFKTRVLLPSSHLPQGY